MLRVGLRPWSRGPNPSFKALRVGGRPAPNRSYRHDEFPGVNFRPPADPAAAVVVASDAARQCCVKGRVPWELRKITVSVPRNASRWRGERRPLATGRYGSRSHNRGCDWPNSLPALRRKSPRRKTTPRPSPRSSSSGPCRLGYWPWLASTCWQEPLILVRLDCRQPRIWNTSSWPSSWRNCLQ